MKKLIFLFMAVVAMAACADDGGLEGGNSGGQPLQAPLTVSATSVDFDSEGGSQSITITSSGEWTATLADSNADDWCSIDVAGGGIGSSKLTITATANDALDDRSALIIVKSGTLSKTITVLQLRKGAIVLAKDSYEIDYKGGALDFEIQANVDITVTISDNAKDWITQVETRGLQTKALYFDIAAYDGDEAREGVITITGGNTTQSIKVKQSYKNSVPSNQIWYTSADGSVVIPNDSDVFRARIVSNIYENGKGVITFDGNVTTIGYEAFLGCESLTSIIIPEGVTTIGGNAFYGCESLTSITIPEGVTYIGGWAFRECSRLTSITIPEGVTTIGDVFYECTGLTSVTIPESVTAIGDFAFYGCSSLTSVTIPESVTTIGDSAFCGCSSLTSITIPESVTTIGGGAFSGCSSLTSVTIPESVTTIVGNAFSVCESLQAFYGKFASSDNRCLVIDGVLHSFAPAGLTSYTIPEGVTTIGGVFYECTRLTSVTIPEGVTTIGDFAFSGCSSLTSITIPESITYIGGWAFSSCISLTSITIPEGVTTIEYMAFAYCESLTSIIIPEGVTTIGGSAFYGCSRLTSATIPESVTTIGHTAFEYCRSLTNVYCKPMTPPTLGYPYSSSSFDHNVSERKFYVPTASVDAYKAADGWKDYADIIVGYDFSE